MVSSREKDVVEIDDKAAGFSTRRPETTQEFAVLVPDKESQATEINAAQATWISLPC